MLCMQAPQRDTRVRNADYSTHPLGMCVEYMVTEQPPSEESRL